MSDLYEIEAAEFAAAQQEAVAAEEARIQCAVEQAEEFARRHAGEEEEARTQAEDRAWMPRSPPAPAFPPPMCAQ